VDSLVERMDSLRAQNRERKESSRGPDYDPMEEKHQNDKIFSLLLDDRNNDVFDPSDDECHSDDEHAMMWELNKYLSKTNRNGALQGKHNSLTTPKHLDAANLRLHVSSRKYFHVILSRSAVFLKYTYIFITSFLIIFFRPGYIVFFGKNNWRAIRRPSDLRLPHSNVTFKGKHS